MKKEVAVLIIHGFYGGNYEIEYLANYLREHTDWHINDITLPGHSHRDDDPIWNTTYNDWIKYSKQQCEEMIDSYDEVYVIGFSMGGVIASYLAALFNQVTKVVLLAPSFDYISLRQIGKDFTNIVFGDGIKNPEEIYHDFTLNKLVKDFKLKTLFDFSKLVSEYRDSIKYVSVPLLIYHGTEDELVPILSSNYAYNFSQSKHKLLIELPGVRHRICMSEKNEVVSKEIIDFFNDSESFVKINKNRRKKND